MSTEEYLHLPREQIRHIVDSAIRAGLAQSRSALLAGIDPAFIGRFSREPSVNAQLFVDLTELNRVKALTDGSVPLFDWLSNATMLAGPRYEADVFRVALEALKITAGVSGSLGTFPRQTTHAGAGEQPRASARRRARALLAFDVPEFWADPRASALHKVLKVAYGDFASVKQIAAVAGVDMSGVASTGGVGDIWFDLLSVAIRASKLERLVDVILMDAAVAFYHPQVQRLVS